jgi:hypothetical protein
MPHDAFISYSTKDRAAADAVCAGLESSGVPVWVAPRDIVPGTNWGGSITKAIGECRAFVLLFSAHSNASPQVTREVERAVGKGKPIVLFRLEDVAPLPDLEYFISAPHWLDATAPPLEARVAELCAQVRILLDQQQRPAAGEFNSGRAAGRLVGPDAHDRAIADSLTAMAEAALADGDAAHAAESLRRAVALNPDAQEARFLLATALLYDGEDVAGAVREFREVVRLNPDHHLAHLALALVLRELGEFEDAGASARAALAVDPASTDARRLVVELRELASHSDADAQPSACPDGDGNGNGSVA